MESLLLGLVGRTESGKDTVGNYFKDRYGFETKAFADPVKEIASKMYGFPLSWAYMHEGKSTVLPQFNNKTVRDLINEVGQAGRSIYEATWIEYLLRQKKPDTPLVVTDCRFPNEANKILEVGGYLICLLRNPRNLQTIPELAVDQTIEDVRYHPRVFHINNRELTLPELYKELFSVKFLISKKNPS